MILTLTCLSTGYEDFDSEFILDADEHKFLFNARDGTQRLCSEHSIRLSKIKSVFISRISPHTLGGLPGMLLSVYDMGLREITIYGPEGLAEFISTLQLFIFRRDYRITVIELENDIKSIDLNVGAIIHPLIVSPNQNTESFVREEVHLSQFMDLHLSVIRRRTQHIGTEISYIIDIPKINGKFCPQKAKALGIPSGPLYGELVSGHSITLNGQVITSEQVMTEATVGPSVLLLNVHTPEVAKLFNQSLIIQDSIKSFSSSMIAIFKNIHPSLSVDLHSVRDKVRIFTFPPSSYHPIIHTASTFVCQRLHSLFPFLFPSLEASLTFPPDLTMISRMIMKLAPLKGQGQLTLPESIDATPAIRPEEEETSKLYSTLLSEKNDSSLTGSLLFLGTGSAVPSKYRNVSSILYRLSSNHLILLDCGEGTFNQLLRVYQCSIDSVLQSLDVVIISHSHADHHLGLPLLLTALAKYQRDIILGDDEKRRKRNEKKLLIFAPRRVKVFLDMYEKFTPCIHGTYYFIEIHHPSQSVKIPVIESIPDCVQILQRMEGSPLPIGVSKSSSPTGVQQYTLSELDLELHFFPMIHCDDSSAVLIHSKGANVLYTGDGRPAYQFSQFFPHGINVDVLINESTFTKDRQEHAEQKNHCTMEEALDVAKQIKAKYTVLTHFSQRYPKNLSHDQGLKGNDTLSLDERAGDSNNCYFVFIF